MQILADENVTAAVVLGLRQRGHDVLSVKESMRAETDEAILARAQTEERLLVTHDKDFGELAFRLGLRSSCGVVLFRLTGANPDSDNQRVLEVLENREDWSGQFSVVTDDRIRMRLLHTPNIEGPK